ncbi:hypothetical protein [Sanyastnella coralliicola]|uniref:hypothetical protein n=1 Tax=Sanyastnella coralliicola TaxID=3069118 RepID=UPI0027B8F409|nr:hypothetical protein [Longitalea sp. SCSIO 12813]
MRYSDSLRLKVSYQIENYPGIKEDVVLIVFQVPNGWWEVREVRELVMEPGTFYITDTGVYDRGRLFYGPDSLVNCELFMQVNAKSRVEDDHEEDSSRSYNSDFYDATDGQLGDLGDSGWTHLGRD